jgi:hypothetical protein
MAKEWTGQPGCYVRLAVKFCGARKSRCPLRLNEKETILRTETSNNEMVRCTVKSLQEDKETCFG